MFFWDHLEDYTDRIAVIEENGAKRKYKELIHNADVLMGGAEARSVVFLQCENSFDSISAYVGCLRHRIVPVMLSDTLPAERYKELVRLYRPRYICCRKDWYASGEVCSESETYHLLATGFTMESIDPSVAVMITTSGSTGSAKFVMQSYENIQCNTEQIVSYLGISADDRAITTLPMSYTYGLSIIQTHLSAGACVIATESTLMQRQFWSMLKEHKATTFGGVPYTYEMLKKMRFERMDLPSLRYLTQAGGKLSKDMVLEFARLCEKKEVRFIVMYGQTEATARMSYLPYSALPDKAGSIGIAVPGGSFSLEDENGKLLTEPDTVGELVYRGKNVTLGYACSADDYASGDRFGGVLHTGDLATVDSDGYYYIVGRKKRFLKVYGNRINLDEAEGLLHSKGYDCACGGRDDLLCVYLVGADAGTQMQLLNEMSELFSINHKAFAVIPVEKIPRNPAGKIQYSVLEATYGDM